MIGKWENPDVFYTLKSVLSNHFRGKRTGFVKFRFIYTEWSRPRNRQTAPILFPCPNEAGHSRNETQLSFFAILDQESFSATVRLNTGCSLEWSFGSEKK